MQDMPCQQLRLGQVCQRQSRRRRPMFMPVIQHLHCTLRGSAVQVCQRQRLTNIQVMRHLLWHAQRVQVCPPLNPLKPMNTPVMIWPR